MEKEGAPEAGSDLLPDGGGGCWVWVTLTGVFSLRHMGPGASWLVGACGWGGLAETQLTSRAGVRRNLLCFWLPARCF